MAKPEAFALILGGGGGVRLWPASRRSRPKQLLTLGAEETLIGATFRRASAVVGLERTLVVTARDQAQAVREALPWLLPDNLVVEPAPRNTAPAVGLGAVEVARRAGADAVLAIIPSDAFIGDEASFAAVLRLALDQARHAIVTVGIAPTRPETGYGYLQCGARLGDGVFAVARFVEKPEVATARAYLASGEYLWNSGMFFLQAGRFLEEARLRLPALGALLDALGAASDPQPLCDESYPHVSPVSIDYGIMEKAAGIRVIPGDFGWNDVGSWAALADIRQGDEAGNVIAGDAVVRSTRGSVVVAEEGAPLVGVVGVEGLVVVATRDAVLVVPKERAQEVRTIVDELVARGRKELL